MLALVISGITLIGFKYWASLVTNRDLLQKLLTGLLMYGVVQFIFTLWATCVLFLVFRGVDWEVSVSVRVCPCVGMCHIRNTAPPAPLLSERRGPRGHLGLLRDLHHIPRPFQRHHPLLHARPVVSVGGDRPARRHRRARGARRHCGPLGCTAQGPVRSGAGPAVPRLHSALLHV